MPGELGDDFDWDAQCVVFANSEIRDKVFWFASEVIRRFIPESVKFFCADRLGPKNSR